MKATLTTKSDVITLVLVFTYGAFAPTQVLELPVSMTRLSKLAHIGDHIPDKNKITKRLTIGGWDTDANFGHVGRASIVQREFGGLLCCQVRGANRASLIHEVREASLVTLDELVFALRVDVFCDGQRMGAFGWIGRDARGQHDKRCEHGDQEHDRCQKEWKGKKGM